MQPQHRSFNQLWWGRWGQTQSVTGAYPYPGLCLPLNNKRRSRNPATCFAGRAAVTGLA